MSMLPADAHRVLLKPAAAEPNYVFLSGDANPLAASAEDRRFYIVRTAPAAGDEPFTHPRPSAPTRETTMEALETPPLTFTLATLPALGQPLAGGIFAGLTTKPDGTHHAVALLPDTPADKLKWDAAMAWAKDLGAELPTRPVAALLFATARSHFEQAWYWTSETDEDDGAFAWCQYFGYGYQRGNLKFWQGRARAVRLIQLTA